MMAPSNSVPLPVLIVVGENAFQMIVSQMLVAMKREMPDPSPYLRVRRHEQQEEKKKNGKDKKRRQHPGEGRLNN